MTTQARAPSTRSTDTTTLPLGLPTPRLFPNPNSLAGTGDVLLGQRAMAAPRRPRARPAPCFPAGAAELRHVRCSRLRNGEGRWETSPTGPPNTSRKGGEGLGVLTACSSPTENLTRCFPGFPSASAGGSQRNLFLPHFQHQPRLPVPFLSQGHLLTSRKDPTKGRA